jgi:hypothetical protein
MSKLFYVSDFQSNRNQQKSIESNEMINTHRLNPNVK